MFDLPRSRLLKSSRKTFSRLVSYHGKSRSLIEMLILSHCATKPGYVVSVRLRSWLVFVHTYMQDRNSHVHRRRKEFEMCTTVVSIPLFSLQQRGLIIFSFPTVMNQLIAEVHAKKKQNLFSRATNQLVISRLVG